jgi:hypothetical protein
MNVAIDEKKRQKKLAKKKAKRKTVVTAKKKAAGKFGLTADDVRDAPVHECLMTSELFDVGIGNVILSRKMPGGDIAVGLFLVDVYCLGVKDAFLALRTEVDYEEIIDSRFGREKLETLHPTCARKLVEGSVAYASDLGLNPHKDYAGARRIFGDLDPDACPRTFEYGKDGKPFYMSGPNDTPARSRKIIETLTKKVGEGNFHYTLALDPEEMDIDEIP